MINKRLVRLLGDSVHHIKLTVVWNFIALIANVVAIFTVGGLLEDAYNKNATTNDIIKMVIVVGIAIVIRMFCHSFAAKSSYLASSKVKPVLREKVYKKLLKLGISYQENVSTSEVVQVSVEGIEQLEIYFGRYLPQLFYSLLAPFTLFIILSFVSFKSALVLLICVPLIPVSIVAVQKFAKKLLNKYWGIYTELGDSFLENLQGLTTLKIYQADEAKSKEMDIEAERFRKITMRVLIMQLNSVSLMDLIAFGGSALGVIVSVTQFQKGNIGITGTFAIIMLASEFFIPLRLLGSFFHIAMNGMAASEKLFRILDMEEPNKEGDCLSEDDTEIILNKLSFAYEKERNILNDVNATILPNSFVSFVGESGCGKSTLVSLIMGMNHSYEGDIIIGNKKLSDVSEESIMNHITLVRHNSHLFKGTVEENLRMGKPNATKDEMDEVLKKVNLYEFLYKEDGLSTKLLEKASNLSGGQCQRLALARALLHDTPIYIFDEATSNIDVESENQIMSIIHELAKTKTVILISHRLANVVPSDIIFLLEDGKIKESGTHEELLNNKGAYANLYESQMKLEGYSGYGVLETPNN